MAKTPPPQETEHDDDELEQPSVLFQGALNGQDANLKANARLVRAGLLPAKQLISAALDRRAETILLEPKGQQTIVRFLIDGVPYPGGRLPRQRGLAITQMVKLLAGLDIQQRKKPQSGGIKAEMHEVPYHLLVESVPVSEGAERLIVRAKNLTQDFESPAEAGFPEDFRKRIREISMDKCGALLVCGPPHSGTTTTSYAVLRSVDAYMLTIHSIADMGGRDVIHVESFEVDPEQSFEETIQRLERIDSNVLFLDPLRHAEAARNAFLAADKMLVISEFTAKDAAHGIIQLCQWLGDSRTVAEKLKAVISQKLIRLLCPECRTAFRPNPKVLARLGLPPETKVLYRAVTAASRKREEDEDEEYEPCKKCQGLGFYGRTGLFEMIEMTEAMQKLVAESPNPAKIKALARQEKMFTLQKAGLDLVAQGKTSLEELQRVFKSG